MVPDKEEVESFVEQVDEISMLIEGLKAGTITPDYIDRRQDLKKQKEEESKQFASARGARGPSPGMPSSGDAAAAKDTTNDEEAKKEAEEARREKLMAKMAELKANLERKNKARQRYAEYVQGKEGGPKGGFGTDYTKWDMWCPDDEEDDMINDCRPNTPEFRALEKDINERHERMLEQRQIAERQRVAGNEAFRTGQYAEALRCYQLGIDSQKTSMTLHANAAQAAIKMQCYVQAIEHCDKVLNIADFLHNNLKDPLCAKAYMRRATAYRALQDYERAVQDLAAAIEIEPDNKELQALHTKAARDLEENRKQKAVRKALKAADSSAGPAAGTVPAHCSGLAIDIEQLRKVEQLVQQLQAAPAAEAATGGRGPQLPPAPGKQGVASKAVPISRPQAAAASQLSELLKDNDTCCVYFRECGGLKAAAALVAAPVSGWGPADLAPVLDALNTACVNDGNLLQLPEQKGLLPATVGLLSTSNVAAAGAAARLLYTASTVDDVRKLVSKNMGKEEVMGSLLQLLAASDVQLQALCLLLLGNCMVDEPVKAAMLKLLCSTPSATSSEGAHAVAPCDVLRQLVQAGNPVVAERALTLVGNMCGLPGLRGALQRAPSLLTAVVEAVVGASKAGSQPLCVAAATALYNLAVEVPTQEAVAASGKVAHLLAMLPGSDKQVVSRVAGVLARCAKQRQAAALITSLHGVPALLKLAGQALDAITAAHGAATQAMAAAQGSKSHKPVEGEDVTALDAVVRTLTILQADGAQSAAVTATLLEGQGLKLLMRVLAEPRLGESVLGNASLLVGNVAKHSQHLPVLRALSQAPRPADAEADGVEGGVPSLEVAGKCVVAGLLRIAYVGQGNTASKNAAIALARMAQDSAMLARLKELRGLEIIYSCAKPV